MDPSVAHRAQWPNAHRLATNARLAAKHRTARSPEKSFSCILAVCLLCGVGSNVKAQISLGHGSHSDADAIVFYEDDFATLHNFAPGVSGPCRLAYSQATLEVSVVRPNNECFFTFFGAGIFSGRIRIDVTASVRQDASNRGKLLYGMAFGVSNSADEKYFFGVTPDGRYGVGLSTSLGIKALIGMTPDTHINKGLNAENVLTAEISGRSILLFINYHYVATATATGEIRGAAGIVLDHDLVASFSHFRVSEFYRPGVAPPPRNVVLGGEADDAGITGDSRTCSVTRQGAYLAVSSAVAEGGYYCRADVPTNTVIPNIDVKSSSTVHYRITSTARLLQGPATAYSGIEITLSSASKGSREYDFLITPNGQIAALDKHNGVARPVLGPQPEAAVAQGYGRDNLLKLEVVNGSARCYVNGKYVGWFAVPASEISSFGPVVGHGPAKAAFRHFGLYRIY